MGKHYTLIPPGGVFLTGAMPCGHSTHVKPPMKDDVLKIVTTIKGSEVIPCA